ncbi:TetR/AcrR family transcriptional regulator [Actinopolyspora erythraea]|uniref:TetR/AcrR family transcriptional regulator n=1 Tax=Actinopolyspora erythraea TaxID=414996 RepID=A0A099DA78_9ACTN|nr:TetR/AcrR family transcriptional regulator [Actinopolyspora erythraea]ASU80633.1 TetR/AcrR family transcriptional regulator [Actinopolyspora erythraea]KGI82682.1 hypothetical protein IL38_01960 [Actinopolyspora erythraea]
MRQARARYSRWAIIEAASELFERKGADATGLTEICEVAGLSRGALYFHFEAKEELKAAVREHAAATIDEYESTLLHDPRPVPVAIRDFTVAMLSLLETDVVTRAGVYLGSESDDSESAHAIQRRWTRLIHDKIASVRDAESVDPGTEAGQGLAWTFSSLIMGLFGLGRFDRFWWRETTVTELWATLWPEVRLFSVRHPPTTN